MNKQTILLLSSLAAVALAVPPAMAEPRGGAGGHSGGAPARGAPAMARSAGGFRQGGFNRWNGNRSSGDWRHRGHFRNRDFFFGGFGYPFFYPYGYSYFDYYPSDYYGYGYYPNGNDYDYYNEPGYGYDYGDRYRGGSSVVALQRQLARAGYYHGAIDGVMGPATRRAMRAYERTHNQRGYGMTDRY